MVAVEDIGKYGRLAFERAEKLSGRSFDIASDELTMAEVAEILAKVTKHPVAYVQIPIEEIRKFNADLALTVGWFEAVGYSADIGGNAKEFGIPPTSFEDWAREHF